MSFLLGAEAVRTLDELRSARVTGRSARILMRLFGEVLIHRRNPYLYQELVASAPRRKRFFENAAKDLETIAAKAEGDPRVLDILARCRALIASFRTEVEGTPELRNRVKRELAGVVGAHNVLFDPFTLVSHATDATDWRLHLPLAVVTPDDEKQVAPLLLAIARLGLKVVPRGAGTGLTGGAVPLRSGCIVVNTEKLNHIRAISQREFQLEDGRTVDRSCHGSRGRSHHRKSDGARRGRRPGLCHRSHQRLGLHPGRQHRGKRGRQTRRALGHLHRQSAGVAHGHARRHALDGAPHQSPAAQNSAAGHGDLRRAG